MSRSNGSTISRAERKREFFYRNAFFESEKRCEVFFFTQRAKVFLIRCVFLEAFSLFSLVFSGKIVFLSHTNMLTSDPVFLFTCQGFHV